MIDSYLVLSLYNIRCYASWWHIGEFWNKWDTSPSWLRNLVGCSYVRPSSLLQKPSANTFRNQYASVTQVGLFEECGSECQMVGLPCNGSCPSGTFLCGEVTLISSQWTFQFLALGLHWSFWTRPVQGLWRSLPGLSKHEQIYSDSPGKKALPHIYDRLKCSSFDFIRLGKSLAWVNVHLDCDHAR